MRGVIGTVYLFTPKEKLAITAGVEAGYGDDDFNDTYFGITPSESAASGYDAFSPGGGFHDASAIISMRYALSPTTAIVGEAKYTKIIQDPADSPIVKDESQPSIRLGIVRRFSFGF